MSKPKAASFLLVGLFTILSIPSLQAADIPYLSWERGREQNIVASQAQDQYSWHIKMVRLGKPALNFKASRPNAKGFIVYSVFLPEDTSLGEYEIYVFGDSSPNGSLVAKVKIISLDRYSIAQAPTDFSFLLLAMVFITTVLSVVRGRKYKYLNFPRQKTAAESGTLLDEKSIPRVLYPAYLMRTGAMNSFRPSVFRFLLICDDTFLYKISPLLWTIFPILGVGLGLQAGYSTHDQMPNIPIYILAAISILGMFDSYSGIFSLVGFAVGQIVSANVSNLREVLVISSLALSWIMPSVFGNLIYLATERDYPNITGTSKASPKNFSLLAANSALVGVFFYASQLLVSSISLRAPMHHPFLMALSVVLSLCFLFKTLFRELLDNRILHGENKDSLVLEVFNLDLLISHSWVAFIGVASGFSAYIITENISVAVSTSFLTLLIFGSLTIRAYSSRLQFIPRWKRNIYYEAFAMTSAVAILFLNIQKLPYQASVKSLIMMATSFGLALLHSLISPLQESLGNSFTAAYQTRDFDVKP